MSLFLLAGFLGLYKEAGIINEVLLVDELQEASKIEVKDLVQEEK